MTSMWVFLQMSTKMAIWSRCVAYVWEISTYTAICRTVISVGSYVPLMMLRGSQLGPQCIFFKTEKIVCLNASLSLLRRYTRYRWYIHLHKNLQNWSRTVRSCLLGGVTPSGNLKLIQFQTITLPLLAASPPHKLLLDQE